MACRYSRCGFACGLHTNPCCHQQIRNGLARSPGVPAIRSNRIVRAKQARGGRQKAHAFRIEQEASRDRGRIGWDCQLLHRRNKDRVRREVQYERIDGRPSHVAVGTKLRVTNVASGQSVTVRVTTAVRLSADGSSTFPTPRPKRWEWLEAVSQRSNLTSSNSRHDGPAPSGDNGRERSSHEFHNGPAIGPDDVAGSRVRMNGLCTLTTRSRAPMNNSRG